MGDPGFPAQHTTTTTVTSNTQVNTSIRYDKGVIRTRDGIIKIAQFVRWQGRLVSQNFKLYFVGT